MSFFRKLLGIPRGAYQSVKAAYKPYLNTLKSAGLTLGAKGAQRAADKDYQELLKSKQLINRALDEDDPRKKAVMLEKSRKIDRVPNYSGKLAEKFAQKALDTRKEAGLTGSFQQGIKPGLKTTGKGLFNTARAGAYTYGAGALVANPASAIVPSVLSGGLAYGASKISGADPYEAIGRGLGNIPYYTGFQKLSDPILAKGFQKYGSSLGPVLERGATTAASIGQGMIQDRVGNYPITPTSLGIDAGLGLVLGKGIFGSADDTIRAALKQEPRVRIDDATADEIFSLKTFFDRTDMKPLNKETRQKIEDIDRLFKKFVPSEARPKKTTAIPAQKKLDILARYAAENKAYRSGALTNTRGLVGEEAKKGDFENQKGGIRFGEDVGKPKTLEDAFKFQDANQEKLVHSSWKTPSLTTSGVRGGSLRHTLEGTGDIFRESTKKAPAISYIDEKVKRLDKFIKGAGSRQLDYKANPEKLNNLKKLWEQQPVTTEAERIARDINLKVIDGDLQGAKKLVDELRSLVTDNQTKGVVKSEAGKPTTVGDILGQKKVQTEPIKGLEDTAKLLADEHRFVGQGDSDYFEMLQRMGWEPEQIDRGMRNAESIAKEMDIKNPKGWGVYMMRKQFPDAEGVRPQTDIGRKYAEGDIPAKDVERFEKTAEKIAKSRGFENADEMLKDQGMAPQVKPEPVETKGPLESTPILKSFPEDTRGLIKDRFPNIEDNDIEGIDWDVYRKLKEMFGGKEYFKESDSDRILLDENLNPVVKETFEGTLDKGDENYIAYKTIYEKMRAEVASHLSTRSLFERLSDIKTKIDEGQKLTSRELSQAENIIRKLNRTDVLTGERKFGKELSLEDFGIKEGDIEIKRPSESKVDELLKTADRKDGVGSRPTAGKIVEDIKKTDSQFASKTEVDGLKAEVEARELKDYLYERADEMVGLREDLGISARRAYEIRQTPIEKLSDPNEIEWKQVVEEWNRYTRSLRENPNLGYIKDYAPRMWEVDGEMVYFEGLGYLHGVDAELTTAQTRTGRGEGYIENFDEIIDREINQIVLDKYKDSIGNKVEDYGLVRTIVDDVDSGRYDTKKETLEALDRAEEMSKIRGQETELSRAIDNVRADVKAEKVDKLQSQKIKNRLDELTEKMEAKIADNEFQREIQDYLESQKVGRGEYEDPEHFTEMLREPGFDYIEEGGKRYIKEGEVRDRIEINKGKNETFNDMVQKVDNREVKKALIEFRDVADEIEIKAKEPMKTYDKKGGILNLFELVKTKDFGKDEFVRYIDYLDSKGLTTEEKVFSILSKARKSKTQNLIDTLSKYEVYGNAKPYINYAIDGEMKAGHIARTFWSKLTHRVVNALLGFKLTTGARQALESIRLPAVLKGFIKDGGDIAQTYKGKGTTIHKHYGFPKDPRGMYSSFENVKESLSQKMGEFKPKSEVARKRVEARDSSVKEMLRKTEEVGMTFIREGEAWKNDKFLGALEAKAKSKGLTDFEVGGDGWRWVRSQAMQEAYIAHRHNTPEFFQRNELVRTAFLFNKYNVLDYNNMARKVKSGEVDKAVGLGIARAANSAIVGILGGYGLKYFFSDLGGFGPFVTATAKMANDIKEAIESDDTKSEKEKQVAKIVYEGAMTYLINDQLGETIETAQTQKRGYGLSKSGKSITYDAPKGIASSALAYGLGIGSTPEVRRFYKDKRPKYITGRKKELIENVDDRDMRRQMVQNIQGRWREKDEQEKQKKRSIKEILAGESSGTSVQREVLDSRQKIIQGLMKQGIHDKDKIKEALNTEAKASGYNESDFTDSEIEGYMELSKASGPVSILDIVQDKKALTEKRNLIEDVLTGDELGTKDMSQDQKLEFLQAQGVDQSDMEDYLTWKLSNASPEDRAEYIISNKRTDFVQLYKDEVLSNSVAEELEKQGYIPDADTLMEQMKLSDPYYVKKAKEKLALDYKKDLAKQRAKTAKKSVKAILSSQTKTVKSLDIPDIKSPKLGDVGPSRSHYNKLAKPKRYSTKL